MQNYPSPYSISEEYDYIDGRITDLINAFQRYGAEQRLTSRLLHYYYRVKRCLADKESETKLKRKLVRRIDECMKEYKVGPPASPTVEKINDMLNEAEKSRSDQSEQQIPSSTPKATGAIPKRTGSTPTEKNPNDSAKVNIGGQDEEMRKRMNHMERMLESVTKMLVEREQPGSQASKNTKSSPVQQGATKNGASEQQPKQNNSVEEDELFKLLQNMSRLLQEKQPQSTQQNDGRDSRRGKTKPQRSGLFTTTDSEDSDEQDERERERSNRHHQMAQDQHRRGDQGTRDDQYESQDSDAGSVHSRRQGRHHGQQHRRDHGMREHLNRVEKWKLRFSGDSRSVSVENFLYKLNKIAELERVPKRQLLRDIHLLLEGPASDWFFTFVDEFEDWTTFEKLIKYRFGNPNQDQGIRLKIQERKQQRGETFIAFVTEIEKLNRMLSKPLSRTRKFEVIWDNMRQHYRSKISIVDVNNLQQLVKLNHRIDAADPSIQHTGEPRRMVHNVDVEGSEYDSDEPTTVNAMRPHPTRENKSSTVQK